MSSEHSAPGEDQNLHFLDYWRVIRSRKEIILAVTLVVALVGAFATSLMDKRYQATCRMKVYQDLPTFQVFNSSDPLQQYNPYFLLTELEVLNSTMILGEVVDKANLTQRWGEEFNEGNELPRDLCIRILQKRIGISQQRNTSNVDITVVASEPTEAAELANLIAQTYMNQRIQSSVDEIRKGLSILEEQMEEQNRKVMEAEDEMERIREELGLSTMDVGVRITVESQRLRQLQADLMAYRVDMLTRKARLEELEKLEGEGLINSLLMSVPDQSLEILRNQVVDAEIQLSMLLETLGENHPDVRRTQTGLAQTKEKLDAAIDGIKAGLRTDYLVSKSKVDALEAELEDVEKADRESRSRKLLPFERAEREVRVKRSILASLQARIAQEGVDIALPRTPVEIFEPALPPEKPFSPNLVLNLGLSCFVGLVFGVGLAFFIEYLDTSVKTVDDVERYLGVPVIGVIPQKVKALNLEGGSDSPHAESYRVLRTNLQFANEGKRGGAFSVCSGGVGEGKSTTLFNLAYVCASLGDRVLVVDSDMRRPVQHMFMNIENRQGLTDILMKNSSVEDMIQPTDVDNLHFLPSGRLPRTAVGVLDNQRVRDLVRDLKARYDMVLFDSPPIMGVSDSSILASTVDGVLLVVQYRKYPRQMSARAKRLVENVGGKVLGVVLNNINILRDDYYYYYSSYYSHYSESGSPDVEEDAPASSSVEERF